MKDMHELKEMLCKELEEYSRKGKMSAGDLETIHKLTDTIKNIDKIEMLEEEEGYSGRKYSRDGEWIARGGYGHSGMPKEGFYHYDDDDSYARRARHYVRGHYSRADGKEGMMSKLEEMLGYAENDRQREAIHNCMKQLENI